MNRPKRLSVRILLILYGLSYFLQNTFFIDRKKVYGAENPSTTNLVAVFVDKDIYPNIKTDLVRYTTSYLQKKIANSKAVVFPVDTKSLKAYEISQILENMYFEGIKDESSKLVGTILIGDIPLPVVQNNGFVYPSIFPYVDFENQEFVYDANKKFFVYNDNPNGQAEIRHGLIKFDTAGQYGDFFQKVKKYNTSPTTFIDKAIRYDDFIGLKKYFIPENTKYYINNIIFSEDIGYHRFTNLLLNILKDEHNGSAITLGDDLKNDLQGTTDAELKAYADDMASRNSEAQSLSQQADSSMPTLTLNKAIQEMLKTYEGLIGTTFLSKMKDNVAGLARRYKTAEGTTIDATNSSTEKILQKDNRMLGDVNNNIQPLLIQMNDFLEGKVNDRVDQEKRYMTIPIPVSQLDLEGDFKMLTVTPKCIRTKYNYYENYYFGQNANLVNNAQETSIYRGTYQNLTSISGQNISDTGQSIGGSYKVFSTQVQANRGYNINKTQEELDLYATDKTNRQDLRNRECNMHLFGYCIRWKRTRKANDSADEDKCDPSDEEKQGGCESFTGFSARYRGGASPMNIDPNTQKLANYNYKDAKYPIYDIAGSKKVDTAQTGAYSYVGAMDYASIIQERFAVKEKQEEKYRSVYSFLANPNINGIDLKFTNQIPSNSDLEHPIRTYNTPRTYAQNDFFSIFTATTDHIINAGKAVLYNRQDATARAKNCNVQGQIYTYKTIDSRVKNISPTRDQVASTDFYKFKDPSDLYGFYTNVMTDLSRTKTDIAQKNATFSGADSTDMTGVVSNLLQLKRLVASGNDGIHDITTFVPTSLVSMSSAQVASLASTRSGKNFNPTRMLEMSGRIEKINEGLSTLLDYINNVSIKNSLGMFSAIIQTEKFKNHNVEILDIWKTQITTNLDYITNNINAFKSTFINARGIYNTIGNVNNNNTIIAAITTQRGLIDALDPSCLPNLCGCDASHYKAICDVLDNLKSTLQSDMTSTGSIVHDRIDAIKQYQDDSNVTVKPFDEINTAFLAPEIFGEITQAKTTMNTFAVSSDPDKKETNEGMNLTTSDRPIDNIRNITFQGIGGTQVRLDYPNLYEVKVYQESGNKLILKSPAQIKEAIKNYLTGKAIEYNALLNQQIQKRDNGYFNGLSAQFNFLGTLDPLANPNTHNYSQNPLPTDYFITQLVTFLDTLENAPEYGKQAIYGNSAADTDDEKLDMIAKLLYYQNIARPERLKQGTVAEDITEIKDSFDINQKISDITSTYLTENNDQGKFITPLYNATGYEVGYINSDGEDYISSKPVPALIQQIQNAQAKPANTFKEAPDQSIASEALQSQVDNCEGVDSNGTALLFDFKTMSSPWIKALECRAKQILKKPFDISIGFKNALGPVFAGSLKDIGNSLESGWNEYGSQRTTQNNNDIIYQAPQDIKTTLQGYDTYAVVNLDKTIMGVDDTGNAQLKIGMVQDMGEIHVKISGTGDNCFSVKRGTTTRPNICNAPAKEFYNPNKDDIAFDIIPNSNHKAGSTALKIELCPPVGNACIVKQQVINIIPGPIKTIEIKTPDTPIRVIQGGEIPLGIIARDSHDNQIGQNIQPYTISVNSGDGKLYDGATANDSIKFDNFFNKIFIYQAPTGFEGNKTVTVTVAQDMTAQKLLINQPAIIPKVVQAKIIVAQGFVKVLSGNSNQALTGITMDLPKDESDIQYMDADDIAQIDSGAIPKFIITVEDKNTNKLTTIANIVSGKGLVKPGTVQTNALIKNNSTKRQTVFTQTNDFIIKDGKIEIALYPSFKAGDDTITISIPGIDPIIIPIRVNAGAAKKVLLTLERSALDLTVNTGSQGTIDIVDTRNNKVTRDTDIMVGTIGAASIDANEFVYSGIQHAYKITAKKPGGEGYLFAYIKDRSLSDQSPGYAKFIIQESILPKEKLNIMYLNLFGTDRGNQRGYFSENDKAVNSITNLSDKLIATTTELVDPGKIKQIEYIISPNGQTQSINTKVATVTIENKRLIIQLPEIADVDIGMTSDFSIRKLTDSGAAATFAKDKNTMLYIPEPTDSIITSNEATASQISINGTDVIDLSQGTIDPNIIITADNEMLVDMSTYTVTFNGKTIGKMMLRSNDDITANPSNINLSDPMTYGTTDIFSEGSTNTAGIGIYIVASAFTKQGYASIEDSADPMLGIGFTSDFKNISNFVNGKSVGEATLAYGSQFLINFGDPLLERRDKNPDIPDTDFDASLGQTIYADPTKTIFKVVPIDFNSDGLKDLLVVYTDGVVKVLKNYGGTQPYKNMQELMIIAVPIKEINIGDVDGNGDEDIFITTTTNKGIVYLNDGGIFPVDGKNVCLNVNAEPDMKNPTPDDFSNIKQMVVEDMDKDGRLDIVTNDSFGDIKIFYGGNTDGAPNYISTVTGTCDTYRYARQKNNYQIIKRYGIQVKSDRYIQDQSLIHRKGMVAPAEGITEEIETAVEEPNPPESDGKLTKEQIKQAKDESKALKDKTINDMKTTVSDTNADIAAGSAQLAYTDNPLSIAPSYEPFPANEISYLPISESNDAASVYKEYADTNGGVLRDGDEVVIKTTIISKKNNNKVTYIDQIKGPRGIAKDSDNKIASLVFTTDNTGGIHVDRNAPEGYQSVMDNIQLDSGEKLSFSYRVKYKQPASAISIDVDDQDLLKEGKQKDTYPDIGISTTDACQKSRRIFFNDKTGNKRSYEQLFDDINKEMSVYDSGAKADQQDAINGLVDQISSVSSLKSVSSLPGMDSLEPRTPKSLLSALVAGGGSININTNFIDAATSKVSKKLDSALQGLCQGFKIGKGGETCGSPLPFNQAFLAPGDYHIFGCVPKPPNPLYAVFNTLNKTIGKGIPVLTIPGNYPSPAGYLPIPGIFGLPFKGATDGYLLGIKGGTRPSQFRLYLAPTLTLGLGMAMCFGPYTVGKALPKPFRDLGGNCIVFALPPLTTNCGDDTGSVNQPRTDAFDPGLVNASKVGQCDNPPKIGNSMVFAPDAAAPVMAPTSNSPFQIVAAGSEENNPHYSAAIPQGNFGGLISIDQDPMTLSADEDYGNATEQLQQGTSYDGYDLNKGEKINLRIVGAKTKGLVKCIVSDWMTRQIQYIQNNLTKMTIQIDLPDLTNVFQGFDKIGNLQETYKDINRQDTQAGYIQTGSSRTDKLSKQQLTNLSQKAGQNPFEAVQQIFNEVPLVNIDTKDLNIKIPALTSEDINKYVNYLKLRIEKADSTLKDRDEFFASISSICNTKELKNQISSIGDIRKQINDLENIQKNGKLNDQQKKDLDKLQSVRKQAELCLKVDEQGTMKKFISFKEDSAGLIRSIKQNINVLEKYKEFPTQLYAWTHIIDKNLTEISSLLSDFVGSITYRLNTNANRFSQYVDAITLLVGAIKTRQAIIDFSVNRSEKCSKCSNDNYGSFSCSLSFLCPKLPIFPIPSFKIPNIYMDMSHIDLGMNIILPKINFVPIKIPLPQLPNLPEPPTVDVNRDILMGLNINFFQELDLPTVPVIPEPPTLPEPPSFIPSIKMTLPVLPPAPKIPKILPEINGVLNVAKFIGKVFCIVKGGIGLVGEKGVKGKIEQITQRTWNVPVFDYFNLTTKFKDPPLQGFDYKLDAYATLKFNFDGVYDVFNNIAQTTNNLVSQNIEAPIQKAVEQTTDTLNNNAIVTGILEPIENFDQNIKINYQRTQEETGMMDYATAYAQLRQGLLNFQNASVTDKTMNDKVKTILATVENRSTILPATEQIAGVKKAAQKMIDDAVKENKSTQKEIQEYDTFIKRIEGNQISLVADNTASASLKAPLMTIDTHTKTILQSQEDPTKTYLALNQRMVQGYLDAVNNDGPEKLNMSQTTYSNSKKYLETTKAKIDTALLAYNDAPLLAANTCTNCSSTAEETNYSTDISAYVNGVFVESYSGTQKSMVNTVASADQVQSVQQSYAVDTDLNNDKHPDILMHDANAIYIKYAKQDSENLSKGGNSLITHYTKFYSYENEHPKTLFTPERRYLRSLDQLRDNSDEYGYTTINDMTIKVVDTYQEAKNFRTDGQSFDNLQLSWKNSNMLGDHADAYIIKVSNKIDDKDTPSSFRDFLGTDVQPKYIVVLPQDTEYGNALVNIDGHTSLIKIETGGKILEVEYYNPEQEKISVTLKDLPRKRLYTSLATLTIQAGGSKSIIYKKTSPRSNQTVAGMQNLGDTTAPVGDIVLWRDSINEAVSTGVAHEGYINTSYTLKSLRTDNVIVSRMEIRQDGVFLTGKDNQAQTGVLDRGSLFFTGTAQQSYDFVAIDQNNNIAKEHVTLDIRIPDIQMLTGMKTSEDTADFVAKISNDLDTGMVIFQRLRNGARKNIDGTRQNADGGFSLSPRQTLITGGIFTIGNDIGLYDNQGNEIATIDQGTGSEIRINPGYENKIMIDVNFATHIPVVELRDIAKNATLFQIALPVEAIADIQLVQGKPDYEQLQLPDGQFGDFNNGYCIKNSKNDCIVYTNSLGAIYIPGVYANSLEGEYIFDKTTKNTTFVIKDQSGKAIANLTVKIKSNK